MWALRRAFWNRVYIEKFRANKPRRIPVPREDSREVRPIPFARRYPDIPIAGISVADHVPRDENEAIKDRLKLRFCHVQSWFVRRFPPMAEGLPQIDPDPVAAVEAAYGRGHRGLLDPPVLPDEYRGSIDLGHLAVAGPYGCYLQAASGGGYEWDLRHLADYDHHPGLRPLGVHVRFEPDQSGERISAVAIDSDLGVCTPADESWELAQKMALCAATNDLSLVRHFNWIHLTAVAQFAIVTRNTLAPAHPVRRLLWPHVWGTHYSNELVTNVLMMKGGDFENVFSFTHRGMCDLFADWHQKYDVRVMDPVADAERRGILKGGFALPYLENRQAHFDVIHAHARRYFALYYASDEDLRGDAEMMKWLDQLEERIPNGIQGLLGADATVEGVARLVAAFIYLGSVEHEALGTGLWNYQVWNHVQPTRIYRRAQREVLDVYQRLVNYNFLLNVSRAPLCQDFAYLAVDCAGAGAFRTFLQDLQALQTRLENEPGARWKVCPAILESGVNG